MLRSYLLFVGIFAVWASACSADDGITGPSNDGPALLSITMRGPSTAAARDDVTYRVALKAAGQSSPQDLAVEAALSGGLAASDASNDGQIDGETIRWSALPAIAVGDSLVLTFTATAPLVGPFGAQASARWSDASQNRTGSSNTLQTILTFDPLLTLEGPSFNGQFGWEMENLGDVDGDGAGDFAVSAPAASQVVVYSGREGRVLYTFRDGVRPGIDLDVPGDVDGDGTVDLVVGAPAVAGEPGDVYVYSMASGASILHLSGENRGDQFGWNAGYLGDIDQDGHDDVIVGANLWDGPTAQDIGRVYIYSGREGTLLRTLDLADETLDLGVGIAAGAQFGHAARGIGDANGDGVPDFAVGAPGLNGGQVFAFSGSDYQLLFPATDGGPGGTGLGAFWISSPGDLNGDGTPDIFASDLNYGGDGQTFGRGRSYVFSGRDGAPFVTLAGQQLGDQFGVGHPAGDLDGDGVGDLIIAGWLRTEGADLAGKVYVYSGRTQQVLRTFTGSMVNQRLGFDAVVVDDVNGDGIADFLLSGNVLGAETANSRGHVYVVAGQPF